MQIALYLMVLVTWTNGGRLDKFGDVPVFSGLNIKLGTFLEDEEFKIPTPKTNLFRFIAADRCFTQPTCPKEAAFRLIDGSCNNLFFPQWGPAESPLLRISEANYNDGDHEPRKARSGRDLPNPRDIVVKVFSTVDALDNVDTLAVMSVGQLISHDTAHTSQTLHSIPPSSCCPGAGDKVHCMNIDVSPNDPFYSQYNVTCLPMVRAGTTASLGCSITPQYVLSSVTHFLDVSFVYGSKEEQAGALRTYSQGQLQQIQINGQSYPPQNPNSKLCPGQASGEFCMNTGDLRANQNPPLGALQVIFFREHNRIATELATLNPDWDDERIYQESRRILVGQWQIIVYRDYLPNIVGEDVMEAKELKIDLENMSDKYFALLHPGTTIEFTMSAFRVYHSQIPESHCAKGAKATAPGCPFGASKFSDSFNNPEILSTPEGFQSVISGLEQGHSAKMDDAITIEVAGKLFRDRLPYGMDLIATDINRCRDVGLGTYNEYRSLCGLSTPTTWEELLATGLFSQKDVDNLASVYETPEDMDVYVPGVLEKKFGKALVGPTFLCFIADQFKRWKEGDRFFVDLKGSAFSFTPEQAKALGGTSLARLFCDNSGGVTTIRRNVFLIGSEQVSCDEIPRVDLTPWQGRPTPAEPTPFFTEVVQKLVSFAFSVM